MPNRAKLYITLVLALGTVGLITQLARFHSADPWLFWLYFAVTVATSGLKVRLPMVFATLSVNFLFILVGIVQFSLPEALMLGAAGTVIQCLWKPRVRPRGIQIVFSTCSIILAVMAAHQIFHYVLAVVGELHPLRIGTAALVYYLVNTSLVAGVIALTERKSIYRTWHTTYFWVLQYHMIAAIIAWLIVVLSRQDSIYAALVLFPIVYFIYRSYRAYIDRLERDKTHVEALAGLHLRTIEALALAIEAKDATTHEHLQRVRVYATEIGKEVGMSATDLEALQAAALLHDIGKLAVPEHIISKPGRLTPEEFEKMKIHPVVGAEILEEVKFPYPVVPIVRAHHEKWDGSGYPYGLSGLDIPLGARILSVVDCFDALASDRQYRRALPLPQAMEIVVSEAGKSFDPVIVDIIQRRYIELEKMAVGSGGEKVKLSMDIKISRGLAPATGFAESAESNINAGPLADSADPLSSIAAATQEAQMLYELTQDLGNSLSLQEALAFVSVRLKRLIPYDTIATYIRRDEKLIPEYVSGENLRLFTALEIPMGQGLSGWVADNNKPILNGNPSVEAGYLNDPTKYSTLRSALAVPLNGTNGVLGVLALYRSEHNAFSKENARILITISAKVALAIENALHHRLLETSITTDYLTNLPNARSLFLSLDNEVSRAQRDGTALAVVVCDLDGFKQVNDRFGHLTGNKVLRVVANGFRDQCEANDYVARMGGDEFVMLVAGGTAESIERKIETMCSVVRAAGDTTPEPSGLSLSIGVTRYPEDGTDAEELLAEADRRMYKSKRLRKKAPVIPIDAPQITAAAS